MRIGIREVLRGRREKGLTLLEVMFALVILAVVAMGLLSLLTSSQQLTNMAREQVIASNAVGAYVEHMRTLSLQNIINDTTTPADYLPSATALKNAKGEVYKVNDEGGAQGVLVNGTYGSANTTTAGAAFPEGTLLGFPRDLNGNALMSDGTIAPSALLILPVRARLTWTSALAGKDTANNKLVSAGSTQSVVVYVCFSN